MNALSLLYVSLGILFLVGCKLMINGLRSASDGYEDIHGFHKGKLPHQKLRAAASQSHATYSDPFQVALKPLAANFKQPASRTAALLNEHRVSSRKLGTKHEDGKTSRLMRRSASEPLSE